MRSAVIANTDIRVSRVSFGTASLHHLFGSRRRQRLLSAAAESGITHFDTSPYYGYGLAEADLGCFLRSQRDGFTVTTKVGLYSPGAGAKHSSSVWARKVLGHLMPRVSLPLVNWQVDRARASLHESLRRLRSEYIDFLLLHEPDISVTQADEFLRWAELERAAGKLRSWGVAGVAERVAPWVMSNHPLARVVQTRDSLDKRQADFLSECGRDFQFTYGYMAASRNGETAQSPAAILEKALQRNSVGSVIVSTRRAERIAQLVQCLP